MVVESAGILEMMKSEFALDKVISGFSKLSCLQEKSVECFLTPEKREEYMS